MNNQQTDSIDPAQIAEQQAKSAAIIAKFENANGDPAKLQQEVQEKLTQARVAQERNEKQYDGLDASAIKNLTADIVNLKQTIDIIEQKQKNAQYHNNNNSEEIYAEIQEAKDALIYDSIIKSGNTTGDLIKNEQYEKYNELAVKASYGVLKKMEKDNKISLNKSERKFLNGQVWNEGGVFIGPALLDTYYQNIFSSSPVRQLTRAKVVHNRVIKSIILNNRLHAYFIPEGGIVPTDQVYNATSKQITLNTNSAPLTVSMEFMREMSQGQNTASDLIGSVDQLITNQLALAIAYNENAKFINGTGQNNEPEGLINNPTSSYEVISPLQSVPGTFGYCKSGSGYDITPDSLIKLINQDLLQEYRPNARLMMNYDTWAYLLMKKDTLGNYLFNRNDFYQFGGEMRLLGVPVSLNTFMPGMDPNNPGQFITGTFPILYGDFERAYTIYDDMRPSLQEYRLPQTPTILYFNLLSRMTGMVGQDQAYRALKISA